ncbi:predicted protein [Botrytis cinerea T4]|uniref:Uncharacterized protein n=1 Tax=Botryotinia fuckeliana (strain T4) TaxID=999810 RepID=G2XTF2_BOTF4|nr:predicted protein [Botrytis cinerea T4]
MLSYYFHVQVQVLNIQYYALNHYRTVQYKYKYIHTSHIKHHNHHASQIEI